MCVLETNRGSITGKILYSDTYLSIPGKFSGQNVPFVKEIPTLTKLAQTPFLGPVGGVARIGLSIIHMVGHIFAALVTWDKGHLFHAAKGGTELLRGMIETLPIIGRIFCMNHDAVWVGSWGTSIRDVNAEIKARFFIIKICNPDAPDNIDRYRLAGRA